VAQEKDSESVPEASSENVVPFVSELVDPKPEEKIETVIAEEQAEKTEESISEVAEDTKNEEPIKEEESNIVKRDVDDDEEVFDDFKIDPHMKSEKVKNTLKDKIKDRIKDKNKDKSTPPPVEEYQYPTDEMYDYNK